MDLFHLSGNRQNLRSSITRGREDNPLVLFLIYFLATCTLECNLSYCKTGIRKKVLLAIKRRTESPNWKGNRGHVIHPLPSAQTRSTGSSLADDCLMALTFLKTSSKGELTSSHGSKWIKTLVLNYLVLTIQKEDFKILGKQLPKMKIQFLIYRQSPRKYYLVFGPGLIPTE